MAAPAEPSPGAVSVRGLTHRYTTRSGSITVLDDLSLAVGDGEFLALVGASGSGKTTLLALLGGLERPQTGTVRVFGEELSSLSGDGLARFRSKTVGFVFQHFGLLDSLTAAENVELACTLGGRPVVQRRRRAADLLGRLGMDDRAGHRPVELSGGERQRVAIARALANEPRLVLADEPTGNLDRHSSITVADVLRRLPDEHGCTVVLVTHDLDLAARADRRLMLDNGRLAPASAHAPTGSAPTGSAPIDPAPFHPRPPAAQYAPGELS